MKFFMIFFYFSEKFQNFFYFYKQNGDYIFQDIRPIHCGPQSESPASSTRLEVVETSDIEIIKNDSDDASGDMISSNQKLINTNGMSTLLSQYNHLQNTNNIVSY